MASHEVLGSHPKGDDTCMKTLKQGIFSAFQVLLQKMLAVPRVFSTEGVLTVCCYNFMCIFRIPFLDSASIVYGQKKSGSWYLGKSGHQILKIHQTTSLLK